MRLIPNSLSWRIIMLHVMVLIALAVALPLAVRMLLSSTAEEYERNRLVRHEAVIANTIRHTPQGWTLELPAYMKAIYIGADTSYDVAMLDLEGKVLFSSRPEGDALFPVEQKAGRPSFREWQRPTDRYFGASFPIQQDGQRIWLQVAQNLDHPDVISDHLVTTFLQRAFWLVLGILALLVLVEYLIVRRALRPVLEASELAGGIGPANLTVRLPADRLPQEIKPLGTAVNQALDRLEQGFRTQQEFTADAAHELRTPLAVLRLRIDGMQDKALTKALAPDIEVMARIVSQLLDVAELESFVLDPDQKTDLTELGRRVVEYMAPLATAKGRHLALSGAGRSWVSGEIEVLFQALRNLAENAIEHSPEGATVEVEVEPGGVIRVLDRGPGVAESERDSVFQRFWRRDRARPGGAGLGLAIVWRIVQAHGGQVWVESRPGGGAAFVVSLRPTAPPPTAHQAIAAE